MNNPDQPVAVSREDRELASWLTGWFNPGLSDPGAGLRSGNHDDHEVLQRIARHRLATRDGAVERLREACAGIVDDYMTSEAHHPGYVLIPTAKFEAIRSATSGSTPMGERIEGAQAVIDRIAEIASIVSAQAGVGGSETAGHIVSYLSAHPEATERLWDDGFFFDLPDKFWMHGKLSWHRADGGVITPKQARMATIVRDLAGPPQGAPK